MTDNLRLFLYYPLGLAPSIFFTLRILIQWIQSEKYKQSYVGTTFWKLSLAGNSLLLIHYIIQIQYPFAFLQATNAFIAWRNLNLLQSKNKYSTQKILKSFLGVFLIITLIFMTQTYFTTGKLEWIRTPLKLFDTGRNHHSPIWHLFGTFGATLFASRFWIQWWNTEKSKKSELGKSFWWISIIGSFFSLIYFVKIQDFVSIINYGFGLIPYIRNLILIRSSQKVS